MANFKLLAVDNLVFDPRLQMRQVEDEVMIRQYAAAIEAGDVLPAPVVYAIDGEKGHFVVDGLHRVKGAKLLTLGAILCEVRVGSWDDAEFAAARLNFKNGKRFTTSEKLLALLKILRPGSPWHEFGDQVIADRLGLTKSTVQRGREKLIQMGQLKRRTATIGADGKRRKVKKIRESNAERKKDNEVPPRMRVGDVVRLVSGRTGTIIGISDDVVKFRRERPGTSAVTTTYNFDNFMKLAPEILQNGNGREWAESYANFDGEVQLSCDDAQLPKGVSVKKIDTGEEVKFKMTPERSAINRKQGVEHALQMILEHRDLGIAEHLDDVAFGELHRQIVLGLDHLATLHVQMSYIARKVHPWRYGKSQIESVIISAFEKAEAQLEIADG